MRGLACCHCCPAEMQCGTHSAQSHFKSAVQALHGVRVRCGSAVEHAGIICACAAGAPTGACSRRLRAPPKNAACWCGASAGNGGGEEGRAKSALAELWLSLYCGVLLLGHAHGMKKGGRGAREGAAGLVGKAGNQRREGRQCGGWCCASAFALCS